MAYILLSIGTLICWFFSVGFDKLGSNNVGGVLASTLKSFLCSCLIFLYIVLTGKLNHMFIFSSPLELILMILFGLASATNWFCYFFAIKRANIEAFAPFNELTFLFSANLWTLIFRFADVVNPEKPLSIIVYLAGLFSLILGSVLVASNKKINTKEKLWIVLDIIACLFGASYTILVPIYCTDIPTEISSFYIFFSVFVVGVIILAITGKLKDIKKLEQRDLFIFALGSTFNAVASVLRFNANMIEGANVAIINCIISAYFVIITLVDALYKKKKFPTVVWIAFALMILGMILNSLSLYI